MNKQQQTPDLRLREYQLIFSSLLRVEDRLLNLKKEWRSYNATSHERLTTTINQLMKLRFSPTNNQFPSSNLISERLFERFADQTTEIEGILEEMAHSLKSVHKEFLSTHTSFTSLNHQPAHPHPVSLLPLPFNALFTSFSSIFERFFKDLEMKEDILGGLFTNPVRETLVLYEIAWGTMPEIGQEKLEEELEIIRSGLNDIAWVFANPENTNT